MKSFNFPYFETYLQFTTSSPSGRRAVLCQAEYLKEGFREEARGLRIEEEGDLSSAPLPKLRTSEVWWPWCICYIVLARTTAAAPLSSRWIGQ